MSTGLVLRCQWEAYLGCLASGVQTFNLIGEGFTSFPEAKNPKEYTRKYVNYQTEKTDVIGYAPSIEYSADCISDDPVVKEIVDIHENERTGYDTHRDVISVNRWQGTPKYTLTTDEDVVAGKVYYTRTGNDPNYVYTKVGNPTAGELGTYYECELSTTEFAATKRTFAIIPGTKGDGTDALIYTGTMKAVSDIIKGTFNVTDKSFTPAT